MVFAIAIFILFGCFGRTVISQKVISHLGVLAGQDTFFNNECRFAVPRPCFDPSLYQFHIPFQLYAAKQMRQLQIPLWNPCFGCGFPTFAELQYCTFSPLRGLFGASNPYMYNLGIVFKALIAAVSSFLLARLLAASTGAAAFAAIAYGLCPFILRELELPNEVEFFPLVACAFLCFANRSTLSGRFLLGTCAALTVVCMHPEFAFLSVICAVTVLCFAKPITEKAVEPSKIAFLPFRGWLKNLLIAAAIGICLAAPLLFPFCELIATADSYKYHETFVQKVPLVTLLVGLITPVCQGGSPFLGVVALALALFAVIAAGKRLRPLSLTVVFLVVWTSGWGPMAQVVAAKPFCFIPPRYFLAPLLLLLTLLAAQGVDLVIGAVAEKQRKRLIPLGLLSIFLATAPYLFSKSAIALAGFDGTLPSPALISKEFVNGAIALCVMLLSSLICIFARIKSSHLSKLAYIFLAANLLSLGGAARLALPPSVSLTYVSSGALDAIKSSGERMTACGRFFFHPNTSMVHDIRDYRLTGPLQPRWVVAFRQLDDRFEKSRYDTTAVSRLLDVASVKYLISRWPIHSSAGCAPAFKSISAVSAASHAVLDEISLLGVDYRLTAEGELFLQTNWQAKNEGARYLAIQTDIVNAAGKVVRKGSRFGLNGTRSGDRIVQHLSIKLPPSKAGQKPGELYVVLYIASVFNEAFVPLNSQGLPTRANGIELLDLSQTEPTEKSAVAKEKRLEFISEDASQILLYKNKKALPQAYFTNSILRVSSLADACKRMLDASFDCHLQTIIESNEIAAYIKTEPAFLIPAATERKNSSTVIVKGNAPSDCYLILTDTYYMGWRAFVDDKPAVIERANISFRAVRVPKGEHTIRFEFWPASLLIGIALALFCTSMVSMIAWLNLMRSARSRSE
ncbi:MAG: YfhO family protein [Candidatus Melainabacteria bacterium]|nr:YfhO family protein [Candidatus Melainabacteria bacterium]